MILERNVRPEEVRVVTVDESYRLAVGGADVLTPHGAPVVHQERGLLQLMLDEFTERGMLTIRQGAIVRPTFLGAYGLYYVQRRFVDSHEDDLSIHFSECLLLDPLLFPPTDVPRWELQQRRCRGALDFVSSQGTCVPNLTEGYLGLQSDSCLSPEERKAELGKLVPLEFGRRMEAFYRSLSPHRRAAAVFLHALHQSVLFPLALVSEHCSPTGYAQGVFQCTTDRESLLVTDPVDKVGETKVGLLRQARAAMDYIDAYDPAHSVGQLVALGRGAMRDFLVPTTVKSAAPPAGSPFLFEIIRHIVAFHNGDGGTLVIGARPEDESIQGVEEAGHPSAAKLLASIERGLRGHADGWSTDDLSSEIQQVDGHEVLVIRCRPSVVPVKVAEFTGATSYYRRRGHETCRVEASEEAEFMSFRQPQVGQAAGGSGP